MVGRDPLQHVEAGVPPHSLNVRHRDGGPPVEVRSSDTASTDRRVSDVSVVEHLPGGRDVVEESRHTCLEHVRRPRPDRFLAVCHLTQEHVVQRGDEDQAVRSDETAELVGPGRVRLGREVGEDAERRDDVDGVVREHAGRQWLDAQVVDPRQARPGQSGHLWIDVDGVQPGRLAEPSEHARDSTPAGSEVEDASCGRQAIGQAVPRCPFVRHGDERDGFGERLAIRQSDELSLDRLRRVGRRLGPDVHDARQGVERLCLRETWYQVGECSAFHRCRPLGP